MAIARKRHREAIESLYEDTCTVITHDPVKVNGVTASYQDVTVYSIQPCRLSFGSSPATSQTDGADEQTQTIELFIAPELTIPAGSRIDVTRQGKTVSYKSSGVPSVYPTHQEIELELFDRWA